MKKMLKLQFLNCKKCSEQRSTVKNCNFSKLQFFKCTSTVVPLHIFAVWGHFGRHHGFLYLRDNTNRLSVHFKAHTEKLIGKGFKNTKFVN